jgi:N6-adenosine-specific RNA methylase IME4
MQATMPVDALRAHPQHERVPAIGREAFAALVADIAASGIDVPLDVTVAGVVLDGHERLRAATELGLETVPVRVVSPQDEVEHMLRGLLHRRHLNPSQLAALALELDEYRRAREQAKERSRANLRGLERAPVPPPAGRTRDLIADIAGVSPRTVQHTITVRNNDPKLFEAVKAGELPAKRAAQEIQRRKRYAAIGEAPPLPQGPFRVIYADPPWQLSNPTGDYAPENHYPTLPLDDIKALPIPAAEEAMLFLWGVNCLDDEIGDVMAAWGFEYRTNIVWVKPSIGLGNYARNRHELLHVGRKGSFPLPEPNDRPDSVIEAPRGRHSEKPAVFYELIERMYPWATRVELFARQARPGWTAWGNETPR